MKVKICGLTSLPDAWAAVASGADLLGFNFYPPSPRYVTPEAAREMAHELRRSDVRVRMVGVFVNQPVADVQRLMAYCDLDLAQLSGDEPPQELLALGPKAFKAIRPADEDQAGQQAAAFAVRGAEPALLLDARVPGRYGGTGQTADWALAASLSAGFPLLLAGGLTPDNLRQALERVRPWGVDVASGVESQPGVKDERLMKAFIETAHEFSGAMV